MHSYLYMSVSLCILRRDGSYEAGSAQISKIFTLVDSVIIMLQQFSFF